MSKQLTAEEILRKHGKIKDDVGRFNFRKHTNVTVKQALAAMEEYRSLGVSGMKWVKCSKRLPDNNTNPAHIVFRNIITNRVLDIHSYWTDELLELNDADIIGKPVGTLIKKEGVEWLDESLSTIEDGWISVDKELPPKDEFFNGHSICVLVSDGRKVYSDIHSFDSGNWIKFVKSITHWRKLPLPPTKL
jgi:hypothetical protein